MKINPNDPASPVMILGEDMRLEAQHTGMPIRLAIAKDLLAASIAKYGFGGNDEKKWRVGQAFQYADALIGAYNESEG